jgi:GNAT superfamily N-acetyltransferase
MDLWAYSLSFDGYYERISAKLVRVVEKLRKRGKFHVRNVDMKIFDEEVEIVKRVYNKSWERNWGFVPFTDAEIEKLAENLKPILDPALSVIVEKDGEPVGFGLCLPDLNQPLRLAYPRKGVPENLTMIKLFWHWKIRRKVTWARGFALGVLPELRGRGVDALMYMELVKGCMSRGYEMAELSWTLENNTMVNRAAAMIGGERYKTYRMYEKQL